MNQARAVSKKQPTITNFATTHRLKTAVDSDHTTIIPGRTGQIYDHGDGTLGVIFQTNRYRTREAWNNRRKKAESVGMTLHQDGDYEGALLFDPTNPLQARTAVSISGARIRKQASASQLESLRRGRQSLGLRNRPLENDPLVAPETTAAGGMTSSLPQGGI